MGAGCLGRGRPRPVLGGAEGWGWRAGKGIREDNETLGSFLEPGQEAQSLPTLRGLLGDEERGGPGAQQGERSSA